MFVCLIQTSQIKVFEPVGGSEKLWVIPPPSSLLPLYLCPPLTPSVFYLVGRGTSEWMHKGLKGHPGIQGEMPERPPSSLELMAI